MAKQLQNIFTPSTDEIAQGYIINSWHVSQSVDAFTAADDYDISITGSLTVTGSFYYTGSALDASPSYALTINPTTGIVKHSTFAGAQGTQGAQGAQGVQGAIGVQGAQGILGAQGAQGVQGDQGAQGAVGVGTPGAQGVQGAQGDQGAIGVGNPGAQGVQGAIGAQGAQGETGVQGAQGVQGSVGTPGAQGVQGAIGAQGEQGAQGRQGVLGAQGAQGAQGAAGASITGSYTGSILTNDIVLINWTGSGVNATAVGNDLTIYIPGGGGGTNITASDEGIPLTTTLQSLDFVGNAVVATTFGNDVTVAINTGSVSVLNLTTASANANYRVLIVDDSGLTDETVYVDNNDGLTFNPSTNFLYVKGDVIAYYTSDESYKHNITPIVGSLEKLSYINGYEFDWDPISGYEGHDIGVIAQEVEKILPEVVTTRENGTKAVKYEKLTAFLISVVKEQQLQIDDLQLKISKLI